MLHLRGVLAQDVGPHVGIGAGDAREISEAAAYAVQRLRRARHFHEGEGDQVRQVAHQRHAFVVRRWRFHDHFGAERLPIAAHRRQGVRVRLRCWRDRDSVPLEEVGARGFGAGLFGTGDGMAGHEVRRQGRERIDDGALDAADVEDESAQLGCVCHGCGDGAHRHRDAGRVAGHQGVAAFVHDAKRLCFAQRVGIAVDADDALEEAARLGREGEGASHHSSADQQQGLAGALVFAGAHLPASMARSSAARNRAFSSGSPMVTRRWRAIP